MKLKNLCAKQTVMSIHGLCFDEGMSGRCGIECRGLDDCDERGNIIDDAIENGVSADELIDLGIFDSYIEMYEYGILHKYLKNKIIGEFRLGVLRAQNKFEFNEEEYFKDALAKYEENL